MQGVDVMVVVDFLCIYFVYSYYVAPDENFKATSKNRSLWLKPQPQPCVVVCKRPLKIYSD